MQIQIYLKLHVTNNLPSTPQFFKWPPTLRFPHRKHVCKYPHTSYISRPSLSFELITLTICDVLHSPVTTSRFGPNVFFKTLLPNTLKLWSPLTTRKHSFTPIQNNRLKRGSIRINPHVWISGGT